MEGSAKRVFLKGAAKLCFSLICGKLLGKCHFQGFLFAASYRGNCNFGGFYWQQAFRKLSGTYHLQGLLLQAIGDIQISGVHFQQALGNFALQHVLMQQALGKLLGKFHVNSWGRPISRVFLCCKLLGQLDLLRFLAQQVILGRRGIAIGKAVSAPSPSGI